VEIVAEVVRNGFVESVHRGTVVHVSPTGDVVRAWGDPDVQVFPRSCNKPIQALGMLRAGLPLEGALLALAMASHSAEQFHLDAVDQILALAGLDRSALQTPASYPLDPKEHAALLRRGGQKAPVLMDCSGKHAAMLLTCVTNGWSTDDYLADDHPVQQVITQTFAELTGADPDPVGADGCGAPLLGTGLRSLAHAIGSIARGDHGEPSQRLAAAWRAHPEYVSGTRRGELALMRAVPGVCAKVGAESVYVAVLPDGSAIAIKIEDGAERPLYVVMNRALELAGLRAPLLAERPAVLGGGQPVGEVRPTL